MTHQGDSYPKPNFETFNNEFSNTEVSVSEDGLTAYLDLISTDKDHRGEGHASRLLSQVLNILKSRGIKKV